MYIAYTSLLFGCPYPFVDELTKRGEEFRQFIYAYMFVFTLCMSLNNYLFIAMHELRESFYEAYL